jgi:hypothetical protein
MRSGVIARSTAFSYKGRQVDPRAIGRALGVAAVLTGVVARDEKTVVVRAELVDVNTGARLWGQEYRRPIEELSAVPRDVAVAVSRELRTRLTGEQQRRLARDYTRSTEAYQQYLRGRFFWNKRTADGYTKAIEHFTGAVTADPTFALAYSGLADSYSMIRSYGIRSAEEVIPLARAAAERALQADDSLAEAQTSIGKIATDTYPLGRSRSGIQSRHRAEPQLRDRPSLTGDVPDGTRTCSRRAGGDSARTGARPAVAHH